MSVRTRVISCLYPSFSKPSDATASTCFVSLAGDFVVDIVGRVCYRRGSESGRSPSGLTSIHISLIS